ncbi:MAG: RtcB family protein [Defluviitaleaceae bacterium]|nr:RtcB family protein [Defluviitaleaceae bacterium]
MKVKIIKTNNVPIKMWCNNPEEGAIEQAINVANLPFAFKHIAIMPDTHQGFGMPIGGVLASKDMIVPNAVGVDIGCGVLACKTSLTEISVDEIKKVMNLIRKNIPLGFNHRKEKQEMKSFNISLEDAPIVKQQFEKAKFQLGTLGGGNHFIEIQKGNDGHIWFMLHSGSRNLGKTVAEYYNKLAIELNKKWSDDVPKNLELAFLPIDTKEGQTYINEMLYCQDFAKQNRDLMAYHILQSMQEVMGNVEALLEYNAHHNFAALENHFGEDVWVHRKGATSAKKGEICIIPGSQGTKSYIGSGLGNPESFNSCSHGAGRTMGRKAAQRSLNLEEEIKRLDNLGIVHGIRRTKDLDEASSAYKDIEVVMEEQKDLVEILAELAPLGVVKG